MTAWRREQTRDPFFRKAKQEHYRARSAYKLLEINRRFELFGRGDTVLDLGAAPGSLRVVRHFDFNSERIYTVLSSVLR